MLEESAKLYKEKRDQVNKKIELIYQEIGDKDDFIFKVKDHAILRYLQRVELIPPSEASYKIRKRLSEFVTEKNIKLEKLNNIIYKIRIQGVIYLVRNFTIITIEIEDV